MQVIKIILLFLASLMYLFSGQIDIDEENFKFQPDKNLKFLILDSNMKIKEIIDVNTQQTKNLHLTLPDNENFYITILQDDSPNTPQDELVQSLKNSNLEDKMEIDKNNSSDSNAIEVHQKTAYESYFERNRFFGEFLGFEPDKFNYALPFNATNNKETKQGKKVEAKFQISIKKRLYSSLFIEDLDLYFAYTQRSFWQLYDNENSRPFRESNYEPKLYLSYPIKDYPLFFHRIDVGYMHQSNGGDVLNSRSWDRLFIKGIYSKNDFIMGLKMWYRIPENRDKDDNPDITNYLGFGELFLGYLYSKHLFTFSIRNNLKYSNKGAVLVDYSYPIYKNLYFYLQYFNGYGESLRDYNNSINRVGIGVLFNR
ncbi:phospholipase A [Helicobacter mesocricetorum]|uniref:phospholipase A n=1 Tax=Helicobacter mesocricetorum TaxID=87012 RepID=UPI00131578E0|nr:phospholipase A [Helicobacter mesocricetorum]